MRSVKSNSKSKVGNDTVSDLSSRQSLKEGKVKERDDGCVVSAET